MKGLRLGMCLLVLSLATAAFADKPIPSVKSLTGDWRSMGGTSAAAIRIKPDGSYEGISTNGAKTAGKITIAGGKTLFQSANSAGTVTLSQEGGKDVLSFVRADGRGSARMERVK